MDIFPYDAVVFDLDGTLFDAEEGIVSSVRRAMDEMGLEVPADADLREVVGPPLADSFRDLLGVPEARVQEAVDRYRRDFSARGMYLYSVYPNIRSILRMLHEAGVHVGLATSKPLRLARDILSYFALDGDFDRIVGEEDAAAKLGKAELIRRALPDRYRRAAMVGDRKFDMAGALANGIEGIGAGYGCGTEEELTVAGASVVVPDTEGLRAVLCPGGEIPRGFFLTVEGPDGSGKSTQLELIAEYLRQNGREVVCTREPGGSEAAERLRQLVLDPQLAIDARTETLLYLAARADHLDKVVRPALASGKIVLCDRFSDSTLVYQGFVRGLPLQELLQLNTFATGGLEPDLTLLLDGDPLLLAGRRSQRGVTDRFENEGLAFQLKVRQGFVELSKAYPQRIRVIDALQEQESVRGCLISELEALLKG